MAPRIPLLTGDVAEEFVRKAEQAEKERGSIDISEYKESLKKILKRSREKGLWEDI